MIGRNDACWCGSGKKWKKCHYPEGSGAPSKQEMTKLYRKRYDILLKSDQEIEGIRRSGRLAANILEELCLFAQEGVTTEQINDLANKLHEQAGAIPAPLGYGQPPFPASVCTSLNDVICHGIPDNTPLRQGDIMNIDVTCILDGYYGDCSQMVMIGQVSEERKKVVEVSYECLQRVMQVLNPGTKLFEIADQIQPYAHSKGCSVVHQFVGHGVGVNFHEGPQISHSTNNSQIELQAGMTFTVEPMINAGGRNAIISEEDGWTAVTEDGKPSAQWEHTFLITDTGYEILTPWKRISK